MKFFLLFAVLAFAVVLCLVEIPKMIHAKLHRELWAFSILLAVGVVLAVLKILDVDIPNPSDFVKKAYSSVTELMKGALEP